MDNTWDGFDLFSMSTCRWTRSFRTKDSPLQSSKQVTFAECGDVVVGGDDEGNFHVYTTAEGSLLDVLHQNRPGMIQTVTVSTPI